MLVHPLTLTFSENVSMNIYSVKNLPSNFYVYAYLRHDNTPYYIGKGKNKRAWSKNHGVNLPKDKNKIIIMEQNLTELGAFALERRYIIWYGRKDNNTGILRNLSDGGDGCSGYKHTEEHKKHISKINTSRKHSDDAKEKIRIKRKQQKISKEHLEKFIYSTKGKMKTEEHRKKISQAHIGISHNKETKIKLSLMFSKGEYLFISPDGEKSKHHSVISFAKQNNLSHFLLYKNVNSGKISTTKKSQLTQRGKNTIGWEVILQSSSSS
jgi:hypothetical protein